MLLDGGYDNIHWPEELDTQLVIFLNEKASEKRKHPRNIRSADLVAADGEFTLIEPEMRRDGMETGESADESVSSSRDRSPFRRRDRAGSSAGDNLSPRAPMSGYETPDSENWMGWAAPARGGADGNSMVEVDPAVASDYVVYQRRRGTSFGGARSATAVRARFVVLKKLESLVAATLPLVDLNSCRDPDSATGRLISIKGRLFEATKMHVWDAAIRMTQDRKEEIPSVTVYRGAAAEHRRGHGVRDWQGTVFGQLFAALEDMPLLRSRSKGKGLMAWQVAFAGEGGDDYGGLFRESIRELAADLQSPATGLFVPVPNSRNATGFNRDTFLPNPACTSPLHLRHYRFIGLLMGSGMRTSNPIGLDLPPLFWKRFLNEEVSLRDLAGVDERWVRAIESVRTTNHESAWKELASSPVVAIVAGVPQGLQSQGGGGGGGGGGQSPPGSGSAGLLMWCCRSVGGHIVELIKGGLTKPVAFSDRAEYVRLAVQARLSEFDRAIESMRVGFSMNVPTFVLPLLTDKELMVRVCGEVTVDLDILKSIIKNKLDGGESDPRMAWLWATLEEFTNEERQQFLGFVWGRERLPRDTSGLQLEVRTQASHGDEHLPSSHTCFNALDMPRYSSQQVLRDKLRYAIAHCKAIDTDFAARGGVGDEAENEGEEENDVETHSSGSVDSEGSEDRDAVTEFEQRLDSTCRMS